MLRLLVLFLVRNFGLATPVLLEPDNSLQPLVHKPKHRWVGCPLDVAGLLSFIDFTPRGWNGVAVSNL
jgi:hypothetical protein